jgi:hypothetical protein
MGRGAERLNQLFLLNICLQMFDGVATYHGVRLYWQEGNPILLAAIPVLGLGQTLLLFKSKACLFLILLRRVGSSTMVHASLAMLAAVYGMFSFIPWMTRILSLLWL